MTADSDHGQRNPTSPCKQLPWLTEAMALCSRQCQVSEARCLAGSIAKNISIPSLVRLNVQEGHRCDDSKHMQPCRSAEDTRHDPLSPKLAHRRTRRQNGRRVGCNAKAMTSWAGRTKCVLFLLPTVEETEKGGVESQCSLVTGLIRCQKPPKDLDPSQSHSSIRKQRPFESSPSCFSFSTFFSSNPFPIEAILTIALTITAPTYPYTYN